MTLAKIATAFVLAAALSAIPSAGTAAPNSVQVKLAGDSIQAPVPKGYCVPSGKHLDLVNAAAAGDTQNVVLAAFLDCREMAGDSVAHLIFLKAPNVGPPRRVTLQEMFDGLGALSEAEVKARLADVSEPEEGLSSVHGQRVTITHGIAPHGHDDVGYYLAGTVRQFVGGTEEVLAGATAMTVVKGHPVFYNVIVRGGAARDVKPALAVAKAETRRLLAANP